MHTATNLIILPIVMLLGLAAALFLGMLIAEEQYVQMSIMAVVVFGSIWAMLGYRYWWLPIFFFLALGGHFFFGFKLYMHEIAVLVCLLPLVLAVAIQKQQFAIRKLEVPWTIIILFLYICLHFMVVVIHNRVNGIGGLGNVSRRYMDAIWPLLIVIPFLWGGNTRYLPWVLHLMAVAYLIRFSLALGFVLTEQEMFLYIPGINYVPAGGGMAQDLRVSGSMLATVCLCYFCLTRSFLLRALLVCVMGVAIYGTFLGGGRVTVVMLFGLFGFTFFIYKNYGAILLWLVAAAMAILFLNAVPEMLYGTHEKIRRAASVFLIDRELAAQTGETELSDEWHSRLQKAGWETWTEDALSILFGRGVLPFEERAWFEGQNFEGMVEMATNTRRFEKALWNTLCTFGIVGLVLYVAVLVRILRECLPILRRDRIATPAHAILFIAVYSIVAWFLLIWISGDFPSSQILFGMVALVAAREMKKGTTPIDEIKNMFEVVGPLRA